MAQPSEGNRVSIIWLFVIILIFCAVFGGFAVNNLFFLLLIFALILVLIGIL